MPFALVVEDGTGVSGANSYCSLDAANTYHDGRLRTEQWQTASQADQERALAMATRTLDEYLKWSGARVDITRESPAWPRYAMYDRGGLLISSTSIPTCLVEATAELALRLIENDRLRQSEDAAIGISSGGRSRSYAAGRTVPIVPPSIADKLSHLTMASTIRRVA